MKRIFPYIFFILLFVISLSSCRKVIDLPGGDVPGGNTEEETTTLSIEVTDGRLNRNGVLSTPSVVFHVECEDEAANFVIEYSVDGGPRKTLKNIWSGVDKKVDSEFRDFKEYGRHVIRGVFYQKEDEDNIRNFEKDVWMLYEPIEVSSISFVCFSRNVAFDDKLTLYKEESGLLEIRYTPAASTAEVAVDLPKGSPVSLMAAEAEQGDGFIRIPFDVTGEGKASLTLSLVNGPEKQEYRSEVSCEVSDDYSGFKPVISAQKLVFAGNGISVLLGVDAVKKDRLYNVDFYIDGALCGGESNLDLKTPQLIVLPSEGLNAGEHTLQAKVTPSANLYYRSVDSDECVFSVYDIVPSITLEKETTPVVPNNGCYAVLLQYNYKVSFPGMPQDVLSVMTLRGERVHLEKAGADYLMTPLRRGPGSFAVSIPAGLEGYDLVSTKEFGVGITENVTITINPPEDDVLAFGTYTDFNIYYRDEPSFTGSMTVTRVKDAPADFSVSLGGTAYFEGGQFIPTAVISEGYPVMLGDTPIVIYDWNKYESLSKSISCANGSDRWSQKTASVDYVDFSREAEAFMAKSKRPSYGTVWEKTYPGNGVGGTDWATKNVQPRWVVRFMSFSGKVRIHDVKDPDYIEFRLVKDNTLDIAMEVSD